MICDTIQRFQPLTGMENIVSAYCQLQQYFKYIRHLNTRRQYENINKNDEPMVLTATMSVNVEML